MDVHEFLLGLGLGIATGTFITSILWAMDNWIKEKA